MTIIVLFATDTPDHVNTHDGGVSIAIPVVILLVAIVAAVVAVVFKKKKLSKRREYTQVADTDDIGTTNTEGNRLTNYGKNYW